jgi:predicted GH43/DUF377 family glycosyl hydrolase
MASNAICQPKQSLILIATSPDGLQWTKTSLVFNDSADVPDAVIGHNGKVFVYFQGLITPTRDGIMVSYSENGIDKWTTQKINLPGAENWKSPACDPDIIYKNGIYRLYFTGNPDNTFPRTFSAISTDGINFSIEEGTRFVVDGQPIMDPSLLQIGDTLHYFAGGAPQGKNWHCTSNDGINFIRQPDFSVNNLMMANGISTGNGFRFYCFSNNAKVGISSMFSFDGSNWNQENGTRLVLDNKLESDEVKDPAVVKYGDKYIMYYVTRKKSSILQNGPWNNALRIAYSNDGIAFGANSVFQDSSGVPTVIKWKGDTLVAAFQWFRLPQNSSSWDKVAVKFSYNNGKSWTEPTPIIINGLPQTYQRPFDPALVVTPHGKIRIYYSSSETTQQISDSLINTYSAISDDGVNYTFEPMPRFDHPNQKIIDPSVAMYKGVYHYLCPKGAPAEGAFHLTSSDGLSFSNLSIIPSDSLHNWTGNFLNINDNELRFYGCGANIWLNKSIDGNNWEGYTKTNLNGGDPAALKLNDNSYLIIYVGPAANFALPEKVVLIAPKNNEVINQKTVQLIWQRSTPNVGDYHLQLSLSNNFQNLIINDSTKKDSTRLIQNLISDTTYYWRVRGRNPNGWGIFSFVNTFRVKSISDYNEIEKNRLLISPNPASDYIEINVGAGSKPALENPGIEIYNVFGEKIPPRHFAVQNATPQEGNLKIDVSNLAPGVYFIKMGNKIEKFVKI